MCEDLEKALKQEPFFDVVGGCGVDLSNGKSQCMASGGIWFRFCPFCGKKIVRNYDGLHWEWHEE